MCQKRQKCRSWAHFGHTVWMYPLGEAPAEKLGKDMLALGSISGCASPPGYQFQLIFILFVSVMLP